MAKAAKLNPSHKRAGWHATYGTVLAGQSEVDGVGALAAELERKWGCGRLRLLVSAELREKFDKQRYLFNQAIYHGELEDVRTQARRMANAWRALDKAAADGGAEPLAADVWEIALADGTVAIIVRDPMQASLVKPEGRAARVWTLDEIGRVLAGFSEAAAVKDMFPGAEVTAVAQTIRDPLDLFPGSSAKLDDPLPDWMTGEEAFA